MTAPYILAGQPPRPMRGPIFAAIADPAAQVEAAAAPAADFDTAVASFMRQRDRWYAPTLARWRPPTHREWPWVRWFRQLVRREIDLALAAERAAGRKFAADMEVWLANLNKDLRGPELFEPAPSRFGDRNDRVPS
jgi:hypothetical protein